MTRVCAITKRRPLVGNNVSHANNKTKRRFLPNLHYRRLWLEDEQRFIRIRVSARGMRTIDKKGLKQALLELKDTDHITD